MYVAVSCLLCSYGIECVSVPVRCTYGMRDVDGLLRQRYSLREALPGVVVSLQSLVKNSTLEQQHVAAWKHNGPCFFCCEGFARVQGLG